MRILVMILVACSFIMSCSKGGDELAPGEKYIVDTMMAGSITKMDKLAKAECDRRRDSLFKATYDSIFQSRAADIRMIRQNPIK